MASGVAAASARRACRCERMRVPRFGAPRCLGTQLPHNRHQAPEITPARMRGLKRQGAARRQAPATLTARASRHASTLVAATIRGSAPRTSAPPLYLDSSSCAAVHARSVNTGRARITFSEAATQGRRQGSAARALRRRGRSHLQHVQLPHGAERDEGVGLAARQVHHKHYQAHALDVAQELVPAAPAGRRDGGAAGRRVRCRAARATSWVA